jgi:hypothetical protein
MNDWLVVPVHVNTKIVRGSFKIVVDVSIELVIVAGVDIKMTFEFPETSKVLVENVLPLSVVNIDILAFDIDAFKLSLVPFFE